MENYLEVLSKAGVKICLVQGDLDQVVPVECSYNIKAKAPNAEVSIIKNANHSSVIVSREKEFTRFLECIWASLANTAAKHRGILTVQ